MSRLIHGLIMFAAAFLAGSVNSVAGGGSLISFPTLVWLGLPSITANATNTIALWPGTLSAVWGYRRELRATQSRMYALTVPSIIGGGIGALLLRLTPGAVFDRLVPILILFATFLFMIQEAVQRLFNRSPEHRGGRWLAGAMLFQLAVGVYGGYFGAGMGILMLAALAILGHDDIHQMNGFKNVLAAAVNGVAAAYFVWMGMVSWPEALVMAVGSIIGGVAATGVARRLRHATIRRIVVAVGFTMAAALLLAR